MSSLIARHWVIWYRGGKKRQLFLPVKEANEGVPSNMGANLEFGAFFLLMKRRLINYLVC